MRLLFILSLLFVSCKKDECPTCKAYATNLEAYPYKVVMPAYVFTIQPGEVKELTLNNGYDYLINGDLQSEFAHDDFQKAYRCPEDCSDILILIQQ